MCETFNKQISLAGPAGRATSDEKIIGDCAWRLLRTFDFDPKELRGLGIQVTKLEGSSVSEPGQAQLLFRTAEEERTTTSRKPQQEVEPMPAIEPMIAAKPIPLPNSQADDVVEVSGPSKHSVALEVPPLSQVDMEVF